MRKETIEFIKENIELINDKKFQEVYEKLTSQQLGYNSLARKIIIDITEAFYTVGINPLKHMSYIPTYMFSGYNGSVVIPKNITAINSSAFWESYVSEITVPGSVETISSSAFSSCYDLNKIILDEGVKVIGRDAFRLGSDMNRIIYIPKSIIKIDTGAFDVLGDRTSNLEIFYSGTKEDWRKIYNKVAFRGTSLIIHCVDGDLLKQKKQSIKPTKSVNTSDKSDEDQILQKIKNNYF